jgi:predicted exporter
MPVSVDAWLKSPASEGWRLLWLTLPNGESGVLVPVDGAKNSAASVNWPRAMTASSGSIAKPALTACLPSIARC